MVETVLYEEMGSVAVATLNRPQSLNSLSTEMFQGLRAAMSRAENNVNMRAFLISGAGRAFCAGGDLGELLAGQTGGPSSRPDPSLLMKNEVNPTVRQLQKMPMPTLAAVNGIAAGAGASLVLGCDIAIASPSASFIQAFSKIGLTPDAGGSWLMVQRLGMARALALTMTGQRLSAAQAKEWGLIWELAEDPLAATMELAKQLSEMPTQALVASRALLRDASTRGFDQHLDVECEIVISLAQTDDFVEGVTAFVEKRSPRFKGR